jgi:hypothetical protein
MSKDDFIAHYKMGNDERREILATSAPTKYKGDLGYGINNAAFAITFKKNADGYWKWTSMYYGD